MSICYIVGAGDFSSLFTPKESDLVIAADGGYDHLVKAGIRCDVLLGDLDSIKKAPSDVRTVKFPVRKDETDMYLAYREGAKRGYSIFHLYGGTGGREDHTFANYCLLLAVKEEKNTAFLISDKSRASIIKNESVTIFGEKGKHFSLFPFGSDCEGVTVKGAEYECEKISLKTIFPLAVSNIFKDSPVNIEVEDGALLLIEEI